MIRLSVGLVAAVSIAGCMDVRTAMERFTPAEADSVARQMIGLAASGATEEMLDLLAPEVRGAEARQGLEQIGAALGGRTLREIELIRSEGGLPTVAAYSSSPTKAGLITSGCLRSSR